MPSATVTSKGQITIPIQVRKSLRLNAGDKIDFVLNDEGHYVVRPKTGSIMEMRGMLRGYALTVPTPTIEEMDEAILDYAAELDTQTMSSFRAATAKPVKKGDQVA